jgi:hypothetical protein
MGGQLVSALRAAGLKNAVGTSEEDAIGRVARALMASHRLSGEEVERIHRSSQLHIQIDSLAVTALPLAKPAPFPVFTQLDSESFDLDAVDEINERVCALVHAQLLLTAALSARLTVPATPSARVQTH